MNILITGGTGAFGQHLVSKLLTNNAYKRICIYSRDEHKQEKMRERFNDDPRLRFFIGDIRDRIRLRLALNGIHHVVHAAALKIVPSAEYNPMEYVKTNVVGTQNIVEAMTEVDVAGHGKVIMLSTDKAVHPINLYGATKLSAEKIFRAANNIRGPSGTKFSTVRYGNVSNSTGSVIPLFLEQIRTGKQLTLTHPDMTRFWITLDEAVDFTMGALDVMYGGETFVPQMPSFKIVDLVDILYEHSDYPLEKRWPYITGRRSGEKLHECIITREENETTLYDGINERYVINPAEWEQSLIPEMDKLNCALTSDCPYVKQLSKGQLADKLREIGVIQ